MFASYLISLLVWYHQLRNDNPRLKLSKAFTALDNCQGKSFARKNLLKKFIVSASIYSITNLSSHILILEIELVILLSMLTGFYEDQVTNLMYENLLRPPFSIVSTLPNVSSKFSVFAQFVTDVYVTVSKEEDDMPTSRILFLPSPPSTPMPLVVTPRRSHRLLKNRLLFDKKRNLLYSSNQKLTELAIESDKSSQQEQWKVARNQVNTLYLFFSNFEHQFHADVNLPSIHDPI